MTTTANEAVVAGIASRRRLSIGVMLLVVGLLGHLVSAYTIRANPRAFPDHLEGFFGIAVATGIIIMGLGWLFWRGRHDITWLVFGAVQAIAGIAVLGLTLRGLH
jgi:hypothetical protein